MNVRQTSLDNGVRLITTAMDGLETAAISVAVDSGARFEAAAVNGVAHMFEHMVFKGAGGRNARQIAEDMEAVGGDLNAATGRDFTSFHARILRDDIPMALDMLADLVLAPTLLPDDLDKERAVVLAELAQAMDTPDDIIFDQVQAQAFPNHPLGRSVLGDVGTIAGFTLADLADWQAQHYRGGGLVISAAGAVDHDRLADQVAARFAAVASGHRPAPVPARWGGGEHVDIRTLEQTHIAFALAGPGYHDADYYPLSLWAMAVGGGMASRLFQRVREEAGLAYSVSAYHSAHEDVGLMTVYFSTDPKDAGKALTLAAREVQRASVDLTAVELARAKAQLKARLFMAQESCVARAEQLASDLFVHGRPMPPAETAMKVEAVTLEAVRAAAAKMLAGLGTLAFARVGPKRGLASRALAQNILAGG